MGGQTLRAKHDCKPQEKMVVKGSTWKAFFKGMKKQSKNSRLQNKEKNIG